MTDKPRVRVSSSGVIMNETARIGATTPNAGLTDNEQVRFDMADKILPTPEQLRELLEYNPETGKLYWKVRDKKWFKHSPARTQEHAAANWNSRYANKEAFTHLHATGYMKGAVFDKKYLAHRVAWAIYHGAWPEYDIDHVSGDRSDNRMCNLRSARRWQNNVNSVLRSDNSSGYKGVIYDKRRDKWCAQIHYDGKRLFIGSYDSAEDASMAYKREAKKHHGEFVRGCAK